MILGEPRPTVQWTQNGTVLNNLPEMSQAFDGKVAKLTFIDIMKEDNGLYTCVFKNSEGEAKSSATIVVERKFTLLSGVMVLLLLEYSNVARHSNILGVGETNQLL